MKKFTTLAAAAAVALSAAAPVVADEAKVNADPFVSSQGQIAIGVGGAVLGTLIAVTIAVAKIESSDDT